MNFKKLFALILITASVLQTTVAARNGQKDGELSPELKEATAKLLTAAAQDARQLNVPENRIRTQIVVGDLLWASDEREARALFQSAVGELRNLLAAVDLPEGAKGMTRAERADFYNQRQEIADLRRELVLSLAGRDAQAALDTLAALKIKTLDEYDPLKADDLELKLTNALARKDPAKSQAVARRQFAENGLTYQFTETLKDLYKKDATLAASVAQEVLAKIKASKIIVPLETMTNAPKTAGVEFYQIAHFINTASASSGTAVRGKDKKIQPLLTDAEMTELVELITNAYLTTQKPSPQAMSQVMREVKLYAPALLPKIQQKVGAANAKQIEKIVESQTYYTDLNEKGVDELLADAARSAPDVRDARLAAVAFKAFESGDLVRAQTIAAQIKERKNHEYLFEQINEGMPLAIAKSGDEREVRKVLAALKTNGEKIAVLTEFASTLAARGEKESAANLLDEAQALMPAYLRTSAEVGSAVKIAAVYAVAAPDKAFALLESGIAQSDEYINAGVKMSEFYTPRPNDANELPVAAINDQLLTIVPNLTVLMRNLARADFQRTVALADKFQRPEIRLFIRLRVLQSLLDTNAAEKEKQTRERMMSEYEG